MNASGINAALRDATEAQIVTIGINQGPITVEEIYAVLPFNQALFLRTGGVAISVPDSQVCSPLLHEKQRA
jgi:hypothetical protein